MLENLSKEELEELEFLTTMIPKGFQIGGKGYNYKSKQQRGNEKMIKDNIIQALEDDTIMDYLANNYYKLDKEQLKNVAIEIYYSYYMATKKHNIKIDFTDAMEELENKL